MEEIERRIRFSRGLYGAFRCKFEAGNRQRQKNLFDWLSEACCGLYYKLKKNGLVFSPDDILDIIYFTACVDYPYDWFIREYEAKNHPWDKMTKKDIQIMGRKWQKCLITRAYYTLHEEAFGRSVSKDTKRKYSDWTYQRCEVASPLDELIDKEREHMQAEQFKAFMDHPAKYLMEMFGDKLGVLRVLADGLHNKKAQPRVIHGMMAMDMGVSSLTLNQKQCLEGLGGLPFELLNQILPEMPDSDARFDALRLEYNAYRIAENTRKSRERKDK